MKDVHDDLHVIEHDPLARRESIHGDGAHAVIVFQPAFDFARDRFEVRLGGSRANDKKIGESRDALEIEDYNVLRLFIRREIGAGFG
jgi:hypothetical protein